MMSIKKLRTGLFISIEGIDGSGKSSVALALKEYLDALEGLTVILTKEPGGTQLGVNLRSLLQTRTFDLCPESEFLLFASDRAQHMWQIIEPNLNLNNIVISDRSADSSLAYQGYGRGLDKEFITKVNAWAMKNRKPDLTIYLKLDYKTAFERLNKRNEELTVFEQEKSDFFNRIIEGFNTIFKDRPNVLIVDASKPIEQVMQPIITHVNNIIAKLAN